MELTEIKNWLRIDGSEDDNVLALLINDAKGALADAGIPEIKEGQVEADPDRVIRYMSSYQLAVMQYVAMNYENREAIGKAQQFHKGYQSRVLQLQLEAKMLLGGETGG